MGLSLTKKKRFENTISPHDTKLVWIRRFGDKELQLCPLCRINIMNKRIMRKNSWSAVHVRYSGGDNIENIVPICYKCTLRYKKHKNINLVDISRGNHDKNLIY
jgi:hypothetical protein